MAVHGVAATAAQVVSTDGKEITLIGFVVLRCISHATLSLIADIDHATVDENFAVDLAHCLLDHTLVTKLELLLLIVILQNQFAKHLRHVYLLNEKALHLVLFLFKSLSNFILCDG